jgi:RNA 2',3'-cyclic 3'-phosphodiesterase
VGAVLDLYFMLYPPALVAQEAARILGAIDGSRRGVSAPMPPDRMHITLQALGRYVQCVPVQVLQMARTAGRMLDKVPFQVSLDLLQSHSSERSLGTVELAGRGHGVQPLRQFHRHLHQALQRAGFPQDMIRRSFFPHITLDYQRVPVARCVVTPLAWRVTEFCLVASHFGESRHEILARWQLTDRQTPLLF